MSNGLNIPETMGTSSVGVGHTLSQQIHNKWFTSQTVEQELASWGFPPMSPPVVSYPAVGPDVLSGPNTQRYTEVFHQVSEWLSYSENTLARIKARLIEINNEMDRVEVKLRDDAIRQAKAQGEKKPSEDTLKGIYKLDARWEELQHQQQIAEQRKIIMDSHAKKCDRDFKLLSRQVEIRKEEISARKVGTNLGARGSQGMYPGGYGQ